MQSTELGRSGHKRWILSMRHWRLAYGKLLELGAKARPAVPALKQMLEDENPAVRQAAADALKKIEAASAGS